MPADAKTMDAALAIKRGESKLADVPEAQRRDVLKALKTTPDRTFRAMALAKHPKRHPGHFRPEPRLRRARVM